MNYAAGEGSPMFARLWRFVRHLMGNVLHWIAWGVAIVVIAQAITMSLATGNPLIPAFVGLVGLAIWIFGVGLRYLFVGRKGT